MRTSETSNYVPSMSMRASVVRAEIERMVDGHVGKIETQLRQWGRRLDELVEQADGGADVQGECRKDVEDLRLRYQAAQAKLAEFKTVGGVRWGTCKLRVEQAWNDLEIAFESLRRDFAGRD